MRRSITFVVVGACALVGALLFPSTSHAQRPLWGQDAWSYSLPGAHIPYDGAPVYERMNYPPAETFLWGDARRQFWTAYEIDHQDRLAAFGTRYTPEHPPLLNRILDRWHRRDGE
jgi:hypothetical protein